MKPLTSYLTRPYLLAYGGFLAVMVGVSIDHPAVHAAGLALRWPALGVAAAMGVIALAVQKGTRLTAIHLILAGFLAILTVSIAWSPTPAYSFLRIASIVLLGLATLAGLFSYCRRLQNAVALTDLLWCLGAMLVVGGFVYRMGVAGTGGRFTGLHDRATGAGTYAALFLPLACFQFTYRFKGPWKVLGGLVCGLFVLQMVLSGSRMALATSFVSTVALAVAYFRFQAIVWLAVGGVLATTPILLDDRVREAVQRRSEHVVRTDTLSSFTGRLERWRFGLEQFREQPIIGHGFGVSRSIAQEQAARQFHIDPNEVFYLHSDQIEVLIDVGIVGGAVFFAFWMALAFAGWSLVTRPVTIGRQLSLAYLAGVWFAFVDTFMHGGFLAAGGGISAYSWTMIAVFLALYARPSRPTQHRRRLAELPSVSPSTSAPRLALVPALNLPRVADVVTSAG